MWSTYFNKCNLFFKKKRKESKPKCLFMRVYIFGKDITKTILRIDTGLSWNEKDVLCSFMKDLGFA